MKKKVSDFVADFLAEHGIKDVFTIVGGGSMHLNDSLGHHPKLKCTYNHHEQASSMAAEAYFRVNGEMACLCVTSGPGATNALTGVAGAYQDSIPMIVISGQCKSPLTLRKNGLKLRTLGPQEFDIIPALDNFTKYAVSVMDAPEIQYCLEKAFYTALNGRPGPCWIEIPVDIQGTVTETDDMRHFTPDGTENAGSISDETADIVIGKLRNAERPVIYAGNGIRIANAAEDLRELVKKLGVPVVTCWDSIDLMETDDPCYAGRGGIMGDRSGNFAVQNSDFLLAIGNRLNIYQVGYQPESWARGAFVAAVDIDEDELKKPTVRIDMPICCDAKMFIRKLSDRLDGSGSAVHGEWCARCREWKEKYPVVSQKQKDQTSPLNVYALIDRLSRSLPENTVTVVANGSASVVGSQTYYIGKNNRFIMNCSVSSMGYDLPASVGACIAGGGKPVVCVAGDGSIQMNIQELQTIVTNRLPIKIVLINNDGYHQVRVTQTNLFNANFVGMGPASGDLGFPDFEKLAWAYGIPYRRCDNKNDLDSAVEWLLGKDSFCMLEACCDVSQFFEPKSAVKRLEDGSLYSPPLEDLAPFLDKEELRSNMYIPLWDEIQVNAKI